MCWSWQVSLAFSIGQFTAIFYLLWRNKYMDRYWALYIFPIAVQEFFQFITWKFGIDEATTPDNCSFANIVARAFTELSIHAPPLAISYICYKTSTISPYKLFWKTLFFADIIIYLLAVPLRLSASHNVCIVPGKSGHLDWCIYREVPTFTEIVPLYYFTSLISSMFLYQPRWVWFSSLLMCISVSIAFGTFGTCEGQSVWCWSGTIVAVSSVLHAVFADWLTARFTKKDIINGNWLIKFFLTGLHEHYTSICYPTKARNAYGGKRKQTRHTKSRVVSTSNLQY